MYIIGLLFCLLFVGCDANMNAFNINIEGTVDYQKNMNNNTNTKGNNTGTNTGNNTGNNAGTNTGNNAGANTGNNTGNNTNTNTNITDNLGTQLGVRTALQVSAGTGIPTTGGESIEVQVYKDYLLMKYSKTLTKVRYSNDIASISDVGIVSNDMARIPTGNAFIKVYFNKDGDSVSKIFEIAKPSKILPSN